MDTGQLIDAIEAIPPWMRGSVALESIPKSRYRRPVGGLERERFLNLFEFVLSNLCRGRMISSILKEYPLEFDEGRFMLWLKHDPTRWSEYCDALSIGGELILAREVDPEIEAARTIPLEASASKARFDKVMKYLGVIDRKRFGQTQQVEINSTINLNSVLAAANARLIEHDADEPVGDVVDVIESSD